MIPVDVLTVLGPGRTVRQPVLDALEHQGNVALNHHVIQSPAPLPGEHRAATIARARNLAKRLGAAHYVMYLDDDVVLPTLGIQKLVYALIFNPYHAAIGIDYQHLIQPSPQAIHIAMGAVMFVRSVLKQLHFRSEYGKCECTCCCEDIRRLGYAIDYLPGVNAQHLRTEL